MAMTKIPSADQIGKGKDKDRVGSDTSQLMGRPSTIPPKTSPASGAMYQGLYGGKNPQG